VSYSIWLTIDTGGPEPEYVGRDWNYTSNCGRMWREAGAATEDGETYWHNPNGKWDWWQLGGRWTGVWSEYDPEQDPANWEQCWLCNGTGMRDDERAREWRARNPEYSCNGCGHDGPKKPGVALKWPTQWVQRPQLDVVPVSKLLDDPKARIPYAICAAPDVWLEKETWTGETWLECPDWPAVARAALELRRDCWIAAVDVHS